MAVADPADSDPVEGSSEDSASNDEEFRLPSIRQLWWPVVQALRELGRPVSEAEITKHVADTMGLTQRQRTELIPSGANKFGNRVRWTVHELKEIDVIHYPEEGRRALTELGSETNEEQIGALRAAYQARKSQSTDKQSDGDEPEAASNAWLIRAGGRGEFVESFIENGLVALGFGHLPDLSEVSSRDEMAALYADYQPEAREGQVRARANQLWAFRSRVRRGDLVLVPGEAGAHFALGTVTREYWYRHDETMRHTVSVDWKRTGVRRTDVGEDLLGALRLRPTVNLIRDEDAARRLQQLMETGRDPGPRTEEDVDLAELAEELLVAVEFLEDIVELLKDKRQVILYGPPGTGKTYLARKLAKVLAPDESCRALVQFHPSTSYEDFFEGYRPAGTGADGGIRYDLTPGPLARMAEEAAEVPDQHVMIIDEINRGNLPRVLGELLFLLEYRDETVQTLYRPEEPFSLPDNLWFIGTMNTADRSIALVDAALRRRFHFVPFFPDSGPMAGLLARWLEREGEPAWVGALVDGVNEELKTVLQGSHLMLGPSHFMKAYGSSPDAQRDRLRRIWEYNIEPFIEDQFFGDPNRIEQFRFKDVWNRHGPSDGPGAGTGGDPRDSEQGLVPANSGSDREFWTSRASDFPPEDHPGDKSYHAEMSQVVRRYVEFALNKGADPGSRDNQLLEEFLSSQEPEYADKTKTDYRRHVRKWFDHAEATWGT